MGAKLTAAMKRVVADQRLAFVATVCSDGTPNLSPKGTISVWDDDHLVFADIAQPGTSLVSVFKPPEGGTTFVSGGIGVMSSTSCSGKSSNTVTFAINP